MTLELPGRRTARVISFPVVVADYDGERYLVSMLGDDTNWVRNVRAAGGRAVLRRGHRDAVRLQEIAADARAPILRRYLALAPGARPHIPVGKDARLEDFQRIAARYPVFRITAVSWGSDNPSRQTTSTISKPALEFSAHMTVRPAQLDGFTKQASECIRLTREHDTRTLRYDWFLSSDGTECEVREAYLDAQGRLDTRRRSGRVVGQVHDGSSCAARTLVEPGERSDRPGFRRSAFR